MSDFEKMERALKALADKSRLEILECIQNGVSNPGEMAKKLNRHRSTIEKHLRVLLKAGIVEKVPSLTRVVSLLSAMRYEPMQRSFWQRLWRLAGSYRLDDLDA
jgi:DNA-binding transcriptional ArsR family regulator